MSSSRSVFKAKQSGYTSPGFFPRSFRGGAGGLPQSQVLSIWGGTPVLARRSTPVQVKMGYPQPGQDGVPTLVRMGYPPARTGVPPPPGQYIRASTCYAAGGMPLAFMQDCLVFNMNIEDFLYPTRWCCGRLAKTDIPITTGGCGR